MEPFAAIGGSWTCLCPSIQSGPSETTVSRPPTTRPAVHQAIVEREGVAHSYLAIEDRRLDGERCRPRARHQHPRVGIEVLDPRFVVLLELEGDRARARPDTAVWDVVLEATLELEILTSPSSVERTLRPFGSRPTMYVCIAAGLPFTAPIR